jgi:hypothetical protein
MSGGLFYKFLLIASFFNVTHAAYSDLWGDDVSETKYKPNITTKSRKSNVYKVYKNEDENSEYTDSNQSSNDTYTQQLNDSQKIRKDLTIKVKKYDLESQYRGLVQENEDKQIATTTLARRPRDAEMMSGVYFSLGANKSSHEYFMYTGTGASIQTTKTAKVLDSSSKIAPSLGFGYRFVGDGMFGLYAAIEAEYLKLNSETTRSIDNRPLGNEYSYKDEMTQYYGVNTKIGFNVKQKLALYVIAGMGNVGYNSTQSVRPSPTPSLDFDFDLNATATVLGFGAEIFFTPEASLFVQATELQAKNKLDYKGGGNTDWSDDLKLQMVRFGINIKLF